MIHKRVAAAAMLAAGLSSESSAAQCDFDKPVGACRAAITVDSTSGSKKSYSAEVTVRSSAGTCSKVEYFLDNTLQTTVIRSGGAEQESLFGTKPITNKSISIQKCTSYASVGDRATGGKTTGSKGEAAADASFFDGVWQGPVGMLVFRAGLELELHANGNRVTGTSTAQNTGESFAVNGTVSGGVLTYTYTQSDNGHPASVRITRKSENSISYAGSGDGVTLSGTLTRP
ncbi:hypothetical protein [Rhizobium leguminosarum]|uniref:hypothetical protein n=1 Tax=Rhizobium leguminosarum TaxID=384 RepID=UPI001040B538|nr:hypothetical protein [Rhizobium leguminosarum]TBY80637.1 hypothetical protein E0H32_19740 [Rhizobium leguminosarum bv. viciae]